MAPTKRHRADERGSLSEQPLPIKMALLLLAAATLVCAVLVAVPLWEALIGGTTHWKSDAGLVECARLKSGEQEACYEKSPLREID